MGPKVVKVSASSADEDEVATRTLSGKLRSRLTGEAGFSLIELVVVMAIMMVVLVAITGSFSSASSSEVNVSKRQQAQADARLGLDRMRQDIHCAYYVQSVSQNLDSNGDPVPGFSLSLTELSSQCQSLGAGSGSNSCGQGTDDSCVFLQWCTVPVPGDPGTFALYRANTTCNSSSGKLIADIVEPRTGWPENSLVTPQPSTWEGNLWPTPRACEVGFLPTQAVQLAVNPDLSASPTLLYELKDEIALRNAARCEQAALSLRVTVPLISPPGALIPATSIKATLLGLLGSGASEHVHFYVFGPSVTPPATCTGGTLVGQATPAGNGVPLHSDSGYTPPAAGTYWWYASRDVDTYGNSAVNTGCPPTTKTVVALVTPTLSVSAPSSGTSGTPILSSSITSTMSGLSGTGASAPITFKVFGPSASAPATCSSGGTTVGTATPSGNGAYHPSAAFTPSGPGTYWWYASWPGDSSNNSTTSGCPPTANTVVTLGSPAVTVSAPATGTSGTTLAALSISATISGLSGTGASAPITIKVFGPSASAPATCTSGGTTVGTVTPSGDGAYIPAVGYTPSGAGNYWWYASWPGDTNNNSAASTCPPTVKTVVTLGSPTLSVSAPANSTTGAVIAASSITATMAGLGGSGASAAITFKVFGPSASAPATCSSGGTTVGTATPAGNGTYNPSAAFTPSTAGNYWWYASWPGDTNNSSAASTCPPTVKTVVTLGSPTLSVSAPANSTTGAVIAASSITATMAGLGGSGASAAITFKVFGPSASAPATCSSGGTTVGTATPAGNGTYNPSAAFTPSTAGNYWWYASWPGDTNNSSAASTCPPTVKTVVVDPDTFLVANPGTQTAGTAFSVTITAKLPGGATDTTYSGSKSVVFSGPANSPNGTAPTYPATVTFTNGVGTASITLFNASNSTTLTATQGPITGTSTSFAVQAGAQSALLYVTSAAGTTTACPTGAVTVGNGGSITVFVAVTDAYRNLTVNGAALRTITITKVSGGGNAPSPGTLTVPANANPAVTSGSSLLKLPNGSPAATTYTASTGALTSVSCVVSR